MATEKVGIEIELIGGEEAHRLLQNLDKDIDRLNKRRSFRSLSGLNKSKAELESYIRELERLQKLRKTKLDSGLSTKSTDKAIAETTAKIKQMSQAYDEATKKARTFSQTAKSITTKVAHIGSAMQSLGNAMTRLTSPFSRLTTGLLYGAGYRVLNLFTEGLTNSFERADTMKNYDRTLRALGLDVEKTFSIAGKKAMTAKENLDEAVQGLPTSLDEIMSKQKIYAGATGEMVESTAIAIAANNAALASGMDARSQLYMQRYMVALASGAELTKTQWQSMGRIAPLVMRQVSKELGYADNEYEKFTADVQSGTIAGKEFLKAFEKVGTSGAVANAARAQTESWGGLFANIRIAVTRLGANVLETLNQTFKDETGRTLLQQLLGWDAEGNDLNDGIKAWINGISESIQDWIKTNPDKILDFFNSLKEFDWKGLMKGFAEGMMWFAKAMSSFAEWASNKDMEKIGRWLPKINLLGRGLTILGGFLKGTRHLWGWLGAGLLKLGGKLGTIGIFGKIASLFGKKKAIVDAGKAAGEIPTVASTFKRAFSALEGLIKAAGAVLIVGTTGFIAFKEVKSILKDVDEIGEILKGMTWVDGVIGIDVALGITALTKAFEAIGSAIGPGGLLNEAIAGASALIVGGTLAGMAWEVKTTLEQIKQTIDTFQEIANELSTFETPEIDGKAILRTIAQINAIYGAISGQGSGGGMGSVLGFLKNPLGSLVGGLAGGAKRAVDASSMASKYASMLEAIKSLKAIASQMNSLAGMKIAEGIDGTISKIASAVNTVYASFPKLIRSKGGAANLNIGAENLANALIGIRRMAYHINKLAGTDLNTSGFSAFIESLKTALADLQSLAGLIELDIEVKLSDKFGRSVTNAVNEIKKGKDKIKKQKSGVSFTIPVSVTFSVSTNVGSAIAKVVSDKAKILSAKFQGNSNTDGGGRDIHGQTTGGMVYRARGGGVPKFKRMGTDTVPAMLTPGEYVHNKRAVNTFGIDFMRKVNNLDVKGAMNELMHRAGGMANVNRGVSITNNNYNNQKVTINNSNNAGAGFTFKSASRFVGAF